MTYQKVILKLKFHHNLFGYVFKFLFFISLNKFRSGRVNSNLLIGIVINIYHNRPKAFVYFLVDPLPEDVSLPDLEQSQPLHFMIKDCCSKKLIYGCISQSLICSKVINSTMVQYDVSPPSPWLQMVFTNIQGILGISMLGRF